MENNTYGWEKQWIITYCDKDYRNDLRFASWNILPKTERIKTFSVFNPLFLLNPILVNLLLYSEEEPMNNVKLYKTGIHIHELS